MLACLLAAVGIPAARAASSPGPTSAPGPPGPCATSPVPATPPAPPEGCPPADPLAAQLQQALAEQARLEATKSALAAEVKTARDQQAILRTLVAADRRAVVDTLSKLADSEGRFAAAQAQVEEARRRADTAARQERRDRELLATYVRERYVRHDGVLAYLVAADSFSDLLDRTATLARLAEDETAMVRAVQDDVRAARAAAATAQRAGDEARAAAAELAEQEHQLLLQVARDERAIADLGSAVGAAGEEIVRADARDAALAQRIADLRIAQLDHAILEAEQAVWAEAASYVAHHLSGLPPELGRSASGGARFVWPAPGCVVTQPFGPSPYPFEPPAFGMPHFHTGLDCAAPVGTPVYAAASGVVAAAAVGSVGYGTHVVVAHDPHALTLYGHLEVLFVRAGDPVTQGQPIGLMGSTGNSTGPHLHFEVRVDDVPTNPAPLLPPLPPGASGPPPLPSSPPLPTPVPGS